MLNVFKNVSWYLEQDWDNIDILGKQRPLNNICYNKQNSLKSKTGVEKYF